MGMDKRRVMWWWVKGELQLDQEASYGWTTWRVTVTPTVTPRGELSFDRDHLASYDNNDLPHFPVYKWKFPPSQWSESPNGFSSLNEGFCKKPNRHCNICHFLGHLTFDISRLFFFITTCLLIIPITLPMKCCKDCHTVVWHSFCILLAKL